MTNEEFESAEMKRKELEEVFNQRMLGVYQAAKKECGYNAIRFLQMVVDQGGLAAAKTLLHTARHSLGLTELWEHKRLDLSMEVVVLEPSFESLFTDDERSIAQKRLSELGFSTQEQA